MRALDEQAQPLAGVGVLNPTADVLLVYHRIVLRVQCSGSGAGKGAHLMSRRSSWLGSGSCPGGWLSTGMKANSRPTMQSCRMSVPMVICPCAEPADLLSVRHLMTMDVDDMETCARAGAQGSGSRAVRIHVRRNAAQTCMRA